jgi:hypothetical protein
MAGGARERPWVRRSATDQFLQVFGVPSPVHRDLGGSALDFTEIVRRQLDCRCADTSSSFVNGP